MFRATLAAIILAITTTPGHAALFTSKAAFDAANPGLPALTFEGIAPAGFGQQVSGTFTGVTISDSQAGHFPEVLSASFTNVVFPGGAPSDFLTSDHHGDTLMLVFNSAQLAAGFDIAAGFTGGVIPSGDFTFTVLNGGTTLRSDTLTIDGLAAFDSFVGYSGLGPITEIDITPVDPFGFPNIDNLAFAGAAAVAEPASSALLLSALAAGFLVERRRRRG